tara:strand:+ start:320 stop:538 length:219 start_codon:yes stop_codon:yes gene_type:complete
MKVARSYVRITSSNIVNYFFLLLRLEDLIFLLIGSFLLRLSESHIRVLGDADTIKLSITNNVARGIEIVAHI